jgi:hypothetical protein
MLFNHSRRQPRPPALAATKPLSVTARTFQDGGPESFNQQLAYASFEALCLPPILPKQLIEYGANVNAELIPHGRTPLHSACYRGNVTNLDFSELLLKKVRTQTPKTTRD